MYFAGDGDEPDDDDDYLLYVCLWVNWCFHVGLNFRQ